MEINNEKVIDFFHLENTPEQDSVFDTYEPQNKDQLIRESNITGHIPNRFSDTKLGQFEVPFLSDVRSFALANNNDRIFFLNGTAGTGKTSLLCGAMHERAMHELNAGLYFSMRFLLPALRSSRSFKALESELEMLERFSSVPFLCLDEIGTANDVKEEGAFLRTVLAARYDNMLPTMIATNLNANMFKVLLAGKSENDFDNSERLMQFLALIDNDPIIDRVRKTIIIKAMTGESKR